MSPQIEELIKNLQLKNTFKQHNNPKAPTLATLIKYVPEKIGKSEILNDIKISALIREFPSMLRMSTWELIYSMNHDGGSMVTFYQKCAQYKTTLLVIQDSNGFVFGGLCNEQWRKMMSFYGTGENFLYTFKNTNELKVFRWTGMDD